MPGNNMANVKQWLEQSTVDYFSHFVKAWIPFNAWYRHNYDTVEHERDILDFIKADGNRIRTRFMAKLEGADPDAEEIRNHIAALHRRLSTDPLRDRRDNRIGFESVSVGKNPKAVEVIASYGWSYKVERKKGPQQLLCEITNRSGVVVHTLTQLGAWSEEELILLPDYLNLAVPKQVQLLSCYRQVNPYLFRTLLADASERNPLVMDGYKFVADKAAIFAGVVDILYAMRNLLFHGELVPDPEANRTYEPAYHLLRHLISTIA